MHNVYNAINLFRHQTGVLVQVVGISIVTQALRIMTHYYAALALNIHRQVPVEPWYFFVFIPMISIVTLLPVSVGGLGVRENAGVLLFRVVGMPAPQAFAMELLSYLMGILAAIPGGIIFSLRRHRTP